MARTVTDASIVSPGRTVIGIVRPAAGTSSYHAEYDALPSALQSNSVPVCSSARDCSVRPPRPTQVAE